MGRIFGTDGARGVAGVDLTCSLAMSIGRATATVISKNSPQKPLVIVGKDTRISSDMLEAGVCAGLSAGGADVIKVGVLPTPAVAYLVKLYNASAGVMISASHNSYEYNGIKLFSSTGYKLSDEQEEEIEALILGEMPFGEEKSFSEIGYVHDDYTAHQKYSTHLLEAVGKIENSEVKAIIDCCNGSACTTALELFKDLGIEYTIINSCPDGININMDCGSTHLGKLAALVLEGGYNIGIAFDGDADRFLAVDENGEIVDGDMIMAILSIYMKNKATLIKDTVVATVMSNLGFMVFAKNNGINVSTAKVGDRYVLKNMLEGGFNLGGEQSGHIIMLDHMTTGDGQLSALMILKIMSETKKNLSTLKNVMKIYPQTLVNIKVSQKIKETYMIYESVAGIINKYTDILGSRGRILVRASGTEPLIRVMVEGENCEEIEIIAKEIADKIKELENI